MSNLQNSVNTISNNKDLLFHDSKIPNKFKINYKLDKKITRHKNSNSKSSIFDKKIDFIKKLSEKKISNFSLSEKPGRKTIICYSKKQSSDSNNKSMKSICTLSTNSSKNDNEKKKTETHLSCKFIQAQEKWKINYWVSVIQKVFRGYYYRKYKLKKVKELKKFGILSSDNILKNRFIDSTFSPLPPEKRKIKEIVIMFNKKK